MNKRQKKKVIKRLIYTSRKENKKVVIINNKIKIIKKLDPEVYVTEIGIILSEVK